MPEGTRKVTAASYIQLQASSLFEHQLLPPQAIKPSPDSRNKKALSLNTDSDEDLIIYPGKQWLITLPT